MESNDVKYSCIFAVSVFVLILIFKGSINPSEMWSSITTAVSITMALRYLFLKWGWKLIPTLENLHKVPNIEGEWEGSFVSTWKASPDSPNATGPITVSIKQPNLYKLKITQRSGESISHSYGESFEILSGGTTMVNFSYRNDPKATVRDRSQISYGSARYELKIKNNLKILSGDYFTDRKSTGTITLEKKY